MTHEELRLFALIPPVYLGFSQISRWSEASTTGMKARIVLVDVGDVVRHPFAGLRWVRKPAEGQRLKVFLQRTEANLELVYYGEATLGWWQEDPAQGLTIDIYFDDGLDGVSGAHPLRDVRDRSKYPRDCETLQMSCWAISDDEMPVAHTPRGPKVPFVAMNATQQAGIKCSDPEFRLWCSEEAGVLLDSEQVAALPSYSQNPADFAADTVRMYCGIASRADLKAGGVRGEDARARWLDMLRKFGVWRNAQQRIRHERD